MAKRYSARITQTATHIYRYRQQTCVFVTTPLPSIKMTVTGSSDIRDAVSWSMLFKRKGFRYSKNIL